MFKRSIVLACLLMIAAGCTPVQTPPQVSVQLTPAEWRFEHSELNQEAKRNLISWLSEMPVKQTQFKLDPSHSNANDIKHVLLTQGAQPHNVSDLPEKFWGEKNLFIAAMTMQRNMDTCPSWKVPNMKMTSYAQTSNFGCATERNLAKMVSDPHDLVRGKALSGASAEHSVNALDRYYRREETQQIFEQPEDPEPLEPPVVSDSQ